MIHSSTPLFINHTWHGHSSQNLATGAQPCPPIALKASANISKGVFVVMECTTVCSFMGGQGQAERGEVSTAVGGGRWNGETPWQGQSVLKQRWLSLLRRGDDGFFFSPILGASLPPSPLCLSIACTRDPQGPSSQPVSWSSPPEQHMIFHDYRYCLCPSSRCLQGRYAADAW